MDLQVWAIGAESEILRAELSGRPLIIKQRSGKPYLLKQMDDCLRRNRTSRECKMLTYARRLGVPTPAVHSVDLSRCQIVMDFIPGEQLKQIPGTKSEAELRKLCEEFGRLIAVLHRGNVVHGDPTTSNVIVDDASKLWMVDFGLAEWNATVEMKGVDLHLIRRAIETTHWDFQETMLDSTLDGYVRAAGGEAEEVLLRMDEIRERGRYH
ncbi:MAG: Kae1-associated kinase Bud32 [Candidatus Thorarchaeota archaeon]|nr:Kae1-associated kinase Bud32 [Candidatus Thorarchaeota archaeon]